MKVAIIWQLIVGFVMAVVHWIESMIQFFFRPSRKDVGGQIVLVTGAGSGLGQALSIAFAKLGCVVVGWDISEAGLGVTRKELAELGLAAQWHSCKCDLSDRHQVYDAAKKLQHEVGDVTILINNAGIVTGKKFLECHDELMIKCMEINAMAHFWTIKAFLPSMLEKNSGHIVTIASGAGLFGMAGQVDYAASKFAAVGLTEALHNEFAYTKKTGVKTTLVCPYYIDTGMFDGASTDFIPIIKLKDAVAQIVDAVLREKAMLIMPRVLYFIYWLKGWLPVKSTYDLSIGSGTMQSMDRFVGRHKCD